MTLKHKSLAMAVLAGFPLGRVALAEQASSLPKLRDNSLTQPILADEAPATQPASQPVERAPLMALLGTAGLADPLEKANINIYGFVEGSYQYNFDGDRFPNAGRTFDVNQNNKAVFNQLDLSIERTVDPSKKQWDLGGRVEMMYGSDAKFVHANGLLDRETPEIQYDIVQAYVDVAVPIGNGLRIRAGKFVTLLGWETINPTTNPFYTHSYLFTFAIPFTHTGVMGTYQINDNWVFEGGIFRGWEQAIDDNNGAISGHVKLAYTSTDKKLGVIAQAVTGPEQMHNTGNYRTVFDFQVTYACTDKLTVGANVDVGYEANATPDDATAWWYGIATYAGYKLNDIFTLNARGEWFRDEEGVRTGIAGNYYEVTLGTTITPFYKDSVLKNFIVRPEIRGDFSNEPAFSNGNEHEMYTAAVDMIFKF